MKFCKDCRFYRPAAAALKISIDESCAYPGPEPLIPDPVTGEFRRGYFEPRQLRKHDGECGIEANWFQERPKPEPDAVYHEAIMAVNEPPEPVAVEPERPSVLRRIFG